MKTRTRFELILAALVTASLLVIACQPKTVVVEQIVRETVEVEKVVEVEKEVVITATPPPEEPPPEEPPPWDDPYEEIKPELCPPDAEPVEQPAFADPIEEEFRGIGMALVQHGVFANEQGELFRIDVIGVDESAMREYTGNVRVCFDQIPAGPIAGSEPSGPPSEDAQSAPIFENGEDVIVWIGLLGVLDPDQAKETIGPLVDAPTDVWSEVLQEYGFDPDEQRELGQEYAFDFVIDPTANSWATHHYPERGARSVWVTTSVRWGGGSVRSALCQNGWRIRSTTVTHGGTPDTADMSHYGGWTTSTYDLGVQGNANGTYRISGRWWWAGWDAGYYASAPTGSFWYCSP